MILQHQDTGKLEDIQDLFTLVFSLNTPFVFLHLLYMGQKQHNVYLYMSTDIFYDKSFYPSDLEKYHSYNHQYIFLCHQYFYIFHKFFYHDVLSEEIFIFVG